MPLPETSGRPSSKTKVNRSRVSVRPERGNLFANYDASWVKKRKALRYQFRTKYDGIWSVTRSQSNRSPKPKPRARTTDTLTLGHLASFVAMPIWSKGRMYNVRSANVRHQYGKPPRTMPLSETSASFLQNDS
jgi:hypothetical protein